MSKSRNFSYGESGVFKVKSGIIICSDPCYGNKPQGAVLKGVNGAVSAMKGEWTAQTREEEDSKRCSHLFIYNTAAARTDTSIKNNIKAFKGELLPLVFGVDSGMFGFYDFDSYVGDGDGEDHFAWYEEVTEKAIHNLIIPADALGGGGCITSAGYGDGGYEVRGIKDDRGQYIALCVEFISEDEEEHKEGQLAAAAVKQGNEKDVYLEMTSIAKNNFKFYRLEDISSVDDDKFETRATWGKIGGGPPCSQVKEFIGQDDLDQYFEKTVDQKRKKGYKDVQEGGEAEAENKLRFKAFMNDENRKVMAREKAANQKAKKAGDTNVQKTKGGKAAAIRTSPPKGTEVNIIDLTLT